MWFIHQIEATDDTQHPSWYTVIRSDEAEEYDGTAAAYGRAVLENWIDDAAARGEEGSDHVDEDGNGLLRVRVAFAGDAEAFDGPAGTDVAVVEATDLAEVVPPELAAVDAARENILYAERMVMLGHAQLATALDAARRGGHGANVLAERVTAAVSRPVALRMMPKVPVRVVWSVVRGESPTARIVEPGVAGVDVPEVILEWAAGHGLSVDDPDVWLGVTLASDAGEVPGEIAYRDGAVSESDGEAIRRQLAGEHEHH
ncbi:hypothetical protein [Streptomyces harbinensis]|uniref:Uncharacterized protein n=1 Tax=Streptomyces harbinensis TaxID=1176198 RepID=A0A1I6WDH2_9ACTN|nr:hypothetical protein [Streptomyces harbinensis]SFT24050.1 hypothetical protein SAMN05444716_1231 [Streptomyces harbinensis]